MISLGQIKVGMRVLFRNTPHEVLSANHVKMGRGEAKLQTKLRNLINQTIFDYTFSGSEKLEEAEISYKATQYLYNEDQVGHFMLIDTYEQVSAPLPESQLKFLKEGSAVDLMLWQEQVIGVKLPKKVELEVTQADLAVKGNTVNTATKNATLETGATIQVPMFIKTGDRIIVNTETGQYDSRA